MNPTLVRLKSFDSALNRALSDQHMSIALILAAIAAFALIAFVTHRFMSKSSDDEVAEPRQKLMRAPHGSDDDALDDGDDSSIAESFPPSTSSFSATSASSTTPTAAAITSFNGLKSIAAELEVR